MSLSKNVYIAILCLAFLYSMLKSYLNVLDEPTTFEETVVPNAGSMPSLTFCQRDWYNDKFETMEDIMDEIENVKENHVSQAMIYTFGKGTEDHKTYYLKNSSLLSSELNISFDEVWSHSAHMQTCGRPYCLIICTTLNIPFISTPPKQGEYEVIHNLVLSWITNTNFLL